MLSIRGLKEPPCSQTFHSILGKQDPGNRAIKCYMPEVNGVQRLVLAGRRGNSGRRVE